MENIYLLPTDKPSKLRYFSGKLEVMHLIPKKSDIDYQNIYITSDEEIKDVRPHTGKWQLEKGQILNKLPNYLTDLSECKLVIMTTDTDLINDGVQAIDNGFLEWYVTNPNCEYVEIEKEKLIIKGEADYFNHDNGQKFNINAGKYKIII